MNWDYVIKFNREERQAEIVISILVQSKLILDCLSQKPFPKPSICGKNSYAGMKLKQSYA